MKDGRRFSRFSGLLSWMEAQGWARLECVGHEHPPERLPRAWYWVTGKILFETAELLFAIQERFSGRKHGRNIRAEISASRVPSLAGDP
jgi:hypothetical protein